MDDIEQKQRDRWDSEIVFPGTAVPEGMDKCRRHILSMNTEHTL